MARFKLSGIGLYALSVVLVSGSNFVTTPLLIRAMGAAEFSRWALLEPILLALIPLAGLGINVGLLQKLSTEPERANALFSALFPLQLVCALAVGLIGLCIFLMVVDAGVLLSATCAAIILAEGGLLLFMAFWRAQNKPAFFVAVDGVRAFALMVAIFLTALAMSASQFTAQTYLGLRFCLALLALAWATFLVKPSWRPDRGLAVSAIRYGLPVTIASFLSTWFLNIDRYAVDRFGSALELTSYVAHSRIAQLLPMAIMSPFFLWFAPKAMRAVAEKGKALEAAADITLAYVAILFWASVNLWLLMPFAWPLIFPSLAFDPLLFGINVLSAAIFSLANPFSIGSLGHGKTHAALLIAGAGLAIAFVCTFAFGTVAAVHGVAYGRLLGILVYTTIFAVFTVRTTGIRYNWQGMLALAIGFLSLAVAASLVRIGPPWLTVASQLLAINLVTAAAAGVALRRRGRKPSLMRTSEVPHG